MRGRQIYSGLIICMIIIGFSMDRALGKECFIFAQPYLYEFILDGCLLQQPKRIDVGSNLRDPAWPTYDKSRDIIYFEAFPLNVPPSGLYIYFFKRSKDIKVEKVVSGWRPSLSPDGNWLSFYRPPNELWVMNLIDKEIHKASSDFFDWQPAVWLDNRRLLYMSADRKLMLLDIATWTSQLTGYKDLMPSALSPDGQQVLCCSYDQRKIYSYLVSSNKIQLIKETESSDIHSSFVWTQNGKSFLYSRQTWVHQLVLSEAADLFLYPFNEKERYLSSKFHWRGGVGVPCSSE